MPAYRSGEFIRVAIASVLLQQGVDLELIVVDDGSPDGTADIVRSIPDARIRLIRNAKRMGIGHCHNLAVAASRAPVIIHVDSDDLILPGALSAMVQALARSSRNGQAYCDFVHLDKAARITPEELHRQVAFLSRHRKGLTDIRRALLVHGMVVGHLRTYRRSALEEVGPFDETLRYGVDYEMALRLAECYEFERVPRVLYCQRVHGDNTQATLRMAPIRFWWNRVRICRRHLRRREGAVLGYRRLELAGVLASSLAHALEIPKLAKGILRPLARMAPLPRRDRP